MHHKKLSGALSALFCILLFCSCNNNAPYKYQAYIDSNATVYGPYRVIKLPVTRGVKILNPIQVSLGPGDRLYAANQSGEVYTLQDTDNDGLEDAARLYCNISEQGLNSPAGFAFRGDTIYIGAREEIRAYLDTNADQMADTSWTFFNDIPHSKHPYEWTSGLVFGPDGWLYGSLTTDSWNAGASPDPKAVRGSLIKIAPDGKSVVRLATGLRSVYGLAFHATGNLFFVDNEGGGNAQEELNLLKAGSFYGHNPKKYTDTAVKTPPVLALQTEMAPGGIQFNSETNDFGGARGDLFIAFYGGGERWNKGGVGRVHITTKADGSYNYKEYPVADVPKLSDVAFGKDGSLYLAHHGKSDYWYNPTEVRSGGFYKLVYDATVKNWKTNKAAKQNDQLSESSVAAGKVLFAQKACAACHSVATDAPELLGPGLHGIAQRLSNTEIWEEIMEPGKRIKPGMIGLKITKKDGQVLLGRVINTGDKHITLMLVGNSVVQIPKSDIAKTENHSKSLMYENLLKGISDTEKSQLLDYLASLK